MVDKVAQGQVFSPSISVFFCLYHSTNAPYSSSSTRSTYLKDKWAKPGNTPESNAFAKIGEHWIEKNFHFKFYVKVQINISHAKQK
jgi:hypothetical protein